jgi:hypothetical protein
MPQKPGVLCLGDSIRLGWSKYLEIPGHEIVSPPDNGRRLANGLKRFPTWAGKRQWHIILAGFGLHDLKHRVVNDTATGQITSPEEYRRLLMQFIVFVQSTQKDARLYWILMTPGGDEARTVKLVQRYNDIAKNVCRLKKVKTIDLFSLALKHPEWRDGIHFTEAGYKAFADLIRSEIWSSDL